MMEKLLKKLLISDTEGIANLICKYLALKERDYDLSDNGLNITRTGQQKPEGNKN